MCSSVRARTAVRGGAFEDDLQDAARDLLGAPQGSAGLTARRVVASRVGWPSSCIGVPSNAVI